MSWESQLIDDLKATVRLWQGRYERAVKDRDIARTARDGLTALVKKLRREAITPREAAAIRWMCMRYEAADTEHDDAVSSLMDKTQYISSSHACGHKRGQEVADCPCCGR